jgi:hypothetical protein
MKCPLCQVEMRITKSRNVVEMQDNTPHLFIEMELSCMNKECKNYDQVVETTKDEQPLG